MKLIVIGGTGLIGTKVVKGLREKGHEVVAASPRTLREITSANRYAPREVVSDPKAPYFGVEINERSLDAGGRHPHRISTNWLNTSAQN